MARDLRFAGMASALLPSAKVRRRSFASSSWPAGTPVPNCQRFQPPSAGPPPLSPSHRLGSPSGPPIHGTSGPPTFIELPGRLRKPSDNGSPPLDSGFPQLSSGHEGDELRNGFDSIPSASERGSAGDAGKALWFSLIRVAVRFDCCRWKGRCRTGRSDLMGECVTIPNARRQLAIKLALVTLTSSRFNV